MAEGSSLVLMHDAGPTGSPHLLTITPVDDSCRRPRVLISLPVRYASVLAARGREASARVSGGPGGASGVVPPVPFPNTVVKRPSANDTAWATAWDNRPVPGPPLTLFYSICYMTGRARMSLIARTAAR